MSMGTISWEWEMREYFKIRIKICLRHNFLVVKTSSVKRRVNQTARIREF